MATVIVNEGDGPCLYELGTDRTLVGSDSECGIVLRHPSAAGCEFVLKTEGDGHRATHLTGRVFLNEVSLESQVLTHKDTLRVGESMLLYKNPEAVEISEPEVSENEGEAEQTDRLEIVSEEQADSIEELLEEIEIELPEEESSDQPVDEPEEATFEILSEEIEESPPPPLPEEDEGVFAVEVESVEDLEPLSEEGPFEEDMEEEASPEDELKPEPELELTSSPDSVVDVSELLAEMELVEEIDELHEWDDVKKEPEVAHGVESESDSPQEGIDLEDEVPETVDDGQHGLTGPVRFKVPLPPDVQGPSSPPPFSGPPPGPPQSGVPFS
ncbi:MAG: FHA domain-containing protein [Planctomycetota bacterium]|nr:FHA domain-containing protein [Planctomycetota bacterium]